MTITPVAVASLTLNQSYNNIKLTMLQRGVFTSFTVTGTDANGNFTTTITNQDGTTSTPTFQIDATVYQVNTNQ